MSNLKVNSINDASGGSNAVLYGVAAPTNSMGFRNRIINGDMRIDQRNAGASVAPSGTAVYNYLTDRWAYNPTQASKMTWGQNLNSVTPPAGYSSYLGGQVGASANVTVGSGDYFFLRQAIEGNNIGDLGFGTANASSITLSFWVRSSLTGTFGGTLANSALNRGYPFTYTISSANTWEQKTITFTGDVTGTWATNNTAGIDVRFGLGAGATYQGTAGSWQAINTVSATGAVNLIATNSATFYITGVQLEAGSVASPFERRDYGRELMMAQRYFQKTYNQSVVPGTSFTAGNNSSVYYGGASSANATASFRLPVVMRASPTVTTYDAAGNAGKISYYNGVWNNNVNPFTFGNESSVVIYSGSIGSLVAAEYTTSAEL